MWRRDENIIPKSKCDENERNFQDYKNISEIFHRSSAKSAPN